MSSSPDARASPPLAQRPRGCARCHVVVLSVAPLLREETPAGSLCESLEHLGASFSLHLGGAVGVVLALAGRRCIGAHLFASDAERLSPEPRSAHNQSPIARTRGCARVPAQRDATASGLYGSRIAEQDHSRIEPRPQEHHELSIEATPGRRHPCSSAARKPVDVALVARARSRWRRSARAARRVVQLAERISISSRRHRPPALTRPGSLRWPWQRR